jgi:hypothetical protein
VDFSNALGIKVGGVYLKSWPVSTIFDLTRFILKLPQSPLLFWAQVFFLFLLAALLLGLIGKRPGKRGKWTTTSSREHAGCSDCS